MTFSCLIRKQPVVRTPEEEVRQKVLRTLTYDLSYPESLIAVEKSLTSMPHLKSAPYRLPQRRIDIAIFTPHQVWGVFPLMLIECKALACENVFLQLMGYNRFIKAVWITVASSEGIQSGFCDSGKWIFQSQIPSYSEALAKLTS